jgi:hypothetical protein
MKRPAFVWAIGLDAIVGERGACVMFRVLEGRWAYGRFDCAFPVEDIGVVTCNRETLDGARASIRPVNERLGRQTRLNGVALDVAQFLGYQDHSEPQSFQHQGGGWV